MDFFPINWRKASRSANNGACVEVGIWRAGSHSGQEGHCVEIGAWRRSSHSTDQGHCVEVVSERAVVLARDSKDPDGPVLGFGAGAWAAFLDAVKSGRLDLA